MARFDAATAVEELEFDFTKYGGTQGVIPEPTTGLVNDFFAGMRTLLNEVRALTADQPELPELEEMNEGEMLEAFDSVEDKMAEAQEYQARTITLIAALCQNEPDEENLSKLPLRVMQAFSKWLMQQINPKAQEETGVVRSLPAPQDRQRGTKRSRAGRG